MKFKKAITILTCIIIALALIASAYGVLSKEGVGKSEFKSLHSEIVQVYGKGLYKNESVSMASQAIAQDIVTLCLGTPLLVTSLVLARRGLLKGRLLLTGVLGYFLYTYTSYSLLAMYNPLFLIYVILMSTSFFAFTLTMMSFNIKEMSSNFDSKLPVRFIGSMLIFIAVAVGLMWLKRIITPLINNTTPDGLEHYTTLVIQALDLGFVIPAAILSGVLLMKRKAFGYLLSSVIVIKETALLTVILAMLISQKFAGVKIGTAEFVIFTLFTLLVAYCMYLILKNVKDIHNN